MIDMVGPTTDELVLISRREKFVFDSYPSKDTVGDGRCGRIYNPVQEQAREWRVLVPQGEKGLLKNRCNRKSR